MIVGRIEHTRRDRGGFNRYLIVECNYCRHEFTAADGRGLRGSTEGYQTMGRIAMCPDCRNDEGRREGFRSAASVPQSTFLTTPRLQDEIPSLAVVRARDPFDTRNP